MSHHGGSRWADSVDRARLWIWTLIVAVVACVAMRDAIRWYGHPVAGLLVDQGGIVASPGLPSWEGRKRGLKFPDRIRPADLPPGTHGSRELVVAWDRAVENASSRGYLDAVVERSSGSALVRLTLRPLEPVVWWTYAGSLILAGLVYAGAGLIALWSSPRGKLARAFASVAIAGGLFMMCFFDAHTSRRLGPLYNLLFPCLPVLTVRFMLYLPRPAPILERHPGLERGALALALGLGLFTVATYFLGGDTRPLQQAFTVALGAGFLLFVTGFVARYLMADASQKQPLQALLWSMVPPYAGVALFLVLLLLGIPFPDFLLYPILIFAPCAALYAFVRHDLWGSRALLSRVATHLFLGALAAALAIGAGTAVAVWFGASFRDALAGATGSGIAAAVLVSVALRLSEFALFRSRAEYKPTIDALSEELITLTSPTDVAHAIERTVRRWLRCDFIALELAAPERGLPRDGDLPGAFTGAEGDGQARGEPLRSEQAEIRLEVSFGGAPYGWLDVGAKRGGALFTSDDIDLLRTIANHGGLALAHAHAYQELEERRRRQAEAWRGEREALVETVAAEISHEIRYPLNYFRSLFELGAKNGRFTDEDVDVGREEVDRLERLVSGLKRMVAHRIERSPTSVTELCVRVEALLRDSLGKLRIELGIGPDATLRGDPDKLTQVLVNLFSNAIEACGSNGRVGIGWQTTDEGGELSVWDDGPGFVGDASRLFNPWYTTKPRGTGLGLAITHRLVRAHGWSIAAFRRDARTIFVVSVRTEDIVPDTSRTERDGKGQVKVA